jgi:hypothetical protein
MKKLVKSVLMLSIASLAILSSCKDGDDEVADVTVTVSSTPASPVVEGTPVKLTIVCAGNTDNKLKSISVTRSSASTTDKVILSKSIDGTSATEEVIDTPPAAGTYNYTVAVEGKSGSPATKVFTLVVTAAPGPIETSPSAIPLFGQTNSPGTSQNFMKLVPNFGSYSTTEFAANKANVDLAFYYGNTNKATISSPSDPQMQGLYGGLDWNGVNTTQLYKTSLTVAQFDAIAAGDDDAEITALAATVTTWSVNANLLNTGSVILYKTANGTLGLIKVANFTGTTANDAEISLSIVAQAN